MKIKNKVFIILGCVIVFLIGMIVQKYINVQNENDFNKQINAMLKYNNKSLEYDVYNRIDAIEKWGGDTTDEWSQLLIKMVSVLNYFEYLQSSSEKIYEFSWEKIYTIINKDIYIDIFYEEAKEIDIKKLTFEEAKIYTNICCNFFIKKYFESYNDTYTAAISRGRILFVPKKSIVKIGETYETNFYCEVRDLAKVFTIEFDNGNIYKDSVYREIATKKGLNIRKGNLYYLGNGKQLVLPFEFSFYVE